MNNKQLFAFMSEAFPLLLWSEGLENFQRGTSWYNCSGVSYNHGLKVELYTKQKDGLTSLTLMVRATILVLVTLTVETNEEELEAQLTQLVENFKHKTNEYLSVVGREVGLQVY